MSSKKALTDAELGFTQKLQLHYPRGLLSPELTGKCENLPAGVLTAYLTKMVEEMADDVCGAGLFKMENSGIWVPAVTEPFIFENHFKADTSPSADVKISYVDPCIRAWKMDAPVAPRGGYSVSSRITLKDASFKTFISGFRNGWGEVDWAAIFFLMKNGFLSHEIGHFFRLGNKAVRVSWCDDGWRVFALSVSVPRWPVGDSVLSRNF